MLDRHAQLPPPAFLLGLHQGSGFAGAAERLGIPFYTISAQARELEKALGHQLPKPAGRGVAMTEAVHAAFPRAEEIFQIGQLVPEDVRAAASGKVAHLAVGLYVGISKMAAHALLAPVLLARAPIVEPIVGDARLQFLIVIVHERIDTRIGSIAEPRATAATCAAVLNCRARRVRQLRCVARGGDEWRRRALENSGAHRI